MRGIRRNPVNPKPHATAGWTQYKCVYCKTRLNKRIEIPAHEATCAYRQTMLHVWTSMKEKALAAEIRQQASSTISPSRQQMSDGEAFRQPPKV